MNDRIYGSFEITEPVIEELIASKPLQRIKKIAQFGMPDRYDAQDGFSRYDHCVGVMLLLRWLGATLEEQIAGLLHDVSHTAFSHVIDWVLGDPEQEGYQDAHHESYIRSTEIPLILSRHGFDVGRLLDYHYFGLLERDAPDLCADRVDYSLRELPTDVACEIAQGLVAQDGMIVCKTEAVARRLFEEYLRLNREHWTGYESTNRYVMLARVLKRGLVLGLITEADVWTDDEAVLAKLEPSTDHEIQTILGALRKRSLAGFPLTKERTKKKFRFVDPLYQTPGGLVRLSATDVSYAATMKQARIDYEQGHFLVDVDAIV